jgi:hypothetical protein
MARYNKKDFIEKMKSLMLDLNTSYEELMDTVVTDPVELEKFGKLYRGGFHDYSFRNMMIAWVQFRDVSILASAKHWKSKGRWMLKGEKAIRIYAPNTYKRTVVNEETGEEEDEYGISSFRLVPVFDIKQTGIPKILTYLGFSFKVIDPLDMTGLEMGAEDYIESNFSYRFEDFIQQSPLPVKKTNSLFEGGSISKEEIEITTRKNELSMINTLFHEEAHHYLDHVGNKNITTENKEIMAESVAYLVSSFYGIKNTKAQYYIGGWKGNKEILKGLGKVVISCAEDLIKLHNTNKNIP